MFAVVVATVPPLLLLLLLLLLLQPKTYKSRLRFLASLDKASILAFFCLFLGIARSHPSSQVPFWTFSRSSPNIDSDVHALAQVSPEPSAFDELSLARLGTLGGGSAAGRGADDLQTIYGGSGGAGGGMGTETSSMMDSQSDYDVTVKCIVQCSQLFGEGVRVGRGPLVCRCFRSVSCFD